MSTATKVSAVDHATQSAHTWIRDVAREFDTEDLEFAYRVLRAWLHTLRDRLTVQASAHFAAQLPDLIRGVYLRGLESQRRSREVRRRGIRAAVRARGHHCAWRRR